MALIPEDKLQEIRSSVNLVHYINQFVNLKKAGKNYKGLCPFHSEKTPSFNVNPEKQIYHCFGCGKGGNIFSFIMEYEKLPFGEAARKAADFAGIRLPKYQSSEEKDAYTSNLYNINEQAARFFERHLWLSKNKAWLDYIKKRNITEETIKAFRLGYAPDSFEELLAFVRKQKIDPDTATTLGLLQKRERDGKYYDKLRHRIIFPFQSLGGKIVGFGGRKLKEEQQPKYLNSPESPIYRKGELLYGLYQAVQSIRNAGFAVLVEGYFDLLRLYDAGMKNVVASSGTALGEKQVRILRRYTNDVYVAYDGDEAGKKAAIRTAYIIEKEDLNAYIVPMPPGEDPDSYVINNGLKAFESLLHEKMLPINFEIEQFLQTDPDPSINDKETFIGQLLEKLADFKGNIKAGLYLHQIAERLEISEHMVIEQLNRLRQMRKRWSKQAPADVSRDEPENVKPQFRTGQYKAEAGVIGLLLNGDVSTRKFILENSFHELFENEQFTKMYEHIVQEFEDNGQIDMSSLMDAHREDETLQRVLSELAFEDIVDQMKYAEDCIFQLKKWRLEKKSRELSALIRSEGSSEESVLHYNQQLSLIRREINALEQERRRHSKV